MFAALVVFNQGQYCEEVAVLSMLIEMVFDLYPEIGSGS